MKITKEMYDKIPAGSVFAVGIAPNSQDGLYMVSAHASIGKPLLWAAKKDEANDWTMYTHWLSFGFEHVLKAGDKVMDKRNRDRVLEVDDEVNMCFRV